MVESPQKDDEKLKLNNDQVIKDIQGGQPISEAEGQEDITKKYSHLNIEEIVGLIEDEDFGLVGETNLRSYKSVQDLGSTMG